jgi:hypothetical protein
MRIAVTVYLMVVSFLLGMLNDKILYDSRRNAVLARYERALTEWKGIQMQLERGTAETGVRRAHALASGRASEATDGRDSIGR